MKNKNSIVILAVVILTTFAGCGYTQTTRYYETITVDAFSASVASDIETSDDATAENSSSAADSEITTEKESSSKATTKPAEKKSTTQTTTKKVTTMQKETSTKKVTTTKKATTTQKSSTTHKADTTKPTTAKANTTKHTHNMPCGNVCKWYSSKDAFMSEYNSKVDYWNTKLENEEISYEECASKVPRGYEVWQCSCGKWTGNYKYK